MKNSTTALLSAAVAALLSLPADGKGMLILQCGSDWCESGEDVRRVFTGQEFRAALGGKFDLAVYDDMENPTPKVKAENAKLEKLCVMSMRLPAITCLTEKPHRLFAQLENIPFDVTPQSLAEMVQAAARKRDEAMKLFDHGRGKGADAANALGRGFELLESQVNEFDRQHLFNGPHAWEEQWRHLEEIDAGDRFGWRRRFTMGYGLDIVEKASSFGRLAESDKWAGFKKSLDAIPTNNLSAVQRQCLEIVPYAYAHGSGSGSGSVSASELDLFRRVLAMGRDTVWGQFALGQLALAGEKVERVEPFRAELITRPETSNPVQTPFKLREIEERVLAAKPGKDGFGDSDKRNIAFYAVLRRIGESGWNELKARPGAVQFLRDFLGDREWMEDFVWSGDCSDWRGAVLALESLCFQDNGRWIDGDGPGRRFATATALEKPSADEAWLADWLDAYRTTALEKRLHKSALDQDVWLWRYAIRQIHQSNDDPPTQQRVLDKIYNRPVNRMGGAMGLIPYRLFNCFGASVHSSRYYEPWRAAGEWPWCRYAPIVGGVCGQVSHFGSRCSNAHGLPSVPVGQPGHCAFTRRMPDGSWVIDNFIRPPTGFDALWRDAGHWTYTAATEATFVGEREKRLDADRWLELAHLAESRGRDAAVVNRLYRRACSSWPRHYTAWRGYGDWIVRAGRPLEDHRLFTLTAMKVLGDWRHPLWDLLTPYFDRVAREQDLERLVAELEEFAPHVRQGDEVMRDEGDFRSVVERWTKPLDGDAALKERAVVAFASAQYGTRTFFTQTLGWCATFLFEDENRAKRFMRLLPKLAERFANSMRGAKGKSTKEIADAITAAKNAKPDLGTFIEAAEKSGNVAAFRQFAAMQEKIGKQVQGPRYKERDFNGDLVSAEGMLTLSKPSMHESPTLHPGAIDASTARGFSFRVDCSGAAPWAMVTLAGPCELKGIVIVNRDPDKALRERQIPLEIEVSEDNVQWQKAFSVDKLMDTYRLEFKYNKRPRARYVRVRRARETDGKVLDGKFRTDDEFRLSKILVYGRKLY